MKSFIPLAVLASSALAKTDIEGCTSFTSQVTVRDEPGYGNTYNTVIWYVSDTLEICKGVDCGGGRAPPKSVPGCPLYEGTETVTPSFLEEDPMKPTQAPEVETSTAAETSAEAEETETDSVLTATAPDTSSETRGIATATAPDTSTETTGTGSATTTPGTTITSMVTSAATTGEPETTSEGGEDDEAATTTGTDTPGAAMPTAAAAFNIVAGVAAAVAFL